MRNCYCCESLGERQRDRNGWPLLLSSTRWLLVTGGAGLESVSSILVGRGETLGCVRATLLPVRYPVRL